MVVRPHPVNSEAWEQYKHPGVVAYPQRGDQADTPASWQEYFDQLSGASAFVGLNTTAFLEAAVADRPCMTIVSDEFFDQQGRTGHFRHLLDADFLEVSPDVDGVARSGSAGCSTAPTRKPNSDSASPSPSCAPAESKPPPRPSSPTSSNTSPATPPDEPTNAAPSSPSKGEMTAPYFTIAIPTKNRSDRVGNAVKSLVDQTFGDLEVIVCDNSDESEAMHTAAVVEAFGDPGSATFGRTGSSRCPTTGITRSPTPEGPTSGS